MTTPLTGREASILCILVTCQSLPAKTKKRILANLSGRALEIAKVILGENTTSKSLMKTAQGFKEWAKNLKPLR